MAFLVGRGSWGEGAGEKKQDGPPAQGKPQNEAHLNQCANAAVKVKGSIFELLYHRWIVRLGHKRTIGAIAHKLSNIIWLILHRGVRYEERGPAVSQKARQARTTKMIKELRKLGYRIELSNMQPAVS